MSISEFEKKRFSKIVEQYIETRRPPPEIRKELDFSYRLTDQSIELFEVRPTWRGKPGEITEIAIAKTTYVKSKNIWKIFWQRSDLKWHSYEPNPVVNSLEEFLAVVQKDEYGCFYG